MTFTEFLSGFAEPGFVFTLMIAFALAYFVALKANPLWQVGLCIFFASYAVTQWANGTQWTLALGWVYCGWAGYAFQKIGGGALLSNIAQGIRNRLQNPPPPASQGQQAPGSEPNRADRRDTHQKRQEEFQKRQRQRSNKSESKQERPQADRPPRPEPEPQKKSEPSPPPSTSSKKPWWKVLGISADADVAAIKKAYRSLIQKYHPDRVSHLGEEFQVIAEEKTKAINRALKESPAGR